WPPARKRSPYSCRATPWTFYLGIHTLHTLVNMARRIASEFVAEYEERVATGARPTRLRGRIRRKSIEVRTADGECDCRFSHIRCRPANLASLRLLRLRLLDIWTGTDL